jgi:hypothetical protein
MVRRLLTEYVSFDSHHEICDHATQRGSWRAFRAVNSACQTLRKTPITIASSRTHPKRGRKNRETRDVA